VAIRAMKSFVDIEDRLDVVIARGQLIETDERVAKRSGIDPGGGARFPGLDIEAKELRTSGFLFAKLKARLARLVGGNAEKDVAVERFRALRFRKGNFAAQFASGLGGKRLRGCGKSTDEGNTDRYQEA